MLLSVLVHISLFWIYRKCHLRTSEQPHSPYSDRKQEGRAEETHKQHYRAPQIWALYRQACNSFIWRCLQTAEGWDWKSPLRDSCRRTERCWVSQADPAGSSHSWSRSLPPGLRGEGPCSDALRCRPTDTWSRSWALCYHPASKWIILTTAAAATPPVPQQRPREIVQ